MASPQIAQKSLLRGSSVLAEELPGLPTLFCFLDLRPMMSHRLWPMVALRCDAPSLEKKHCGALMAQLPDVNKDLALHPVT
mmetsp:Transcript_18264/g.42566  ORF Transcript_18264/g.42566 Transcript_18264/m.42566 type:complete len:81 (+) Transcript_18264:340-582(+)